MPLLRQLIVVLWRHTNTYCDVILAECPQSVSNWGTCVFQPSSSCLFVKQSWRPSGNKARELAWDRFYWYGLTLIPARISNYIHHEMWGDKTYPFSNFNGATFEVWEWINNSMPHFNGHVITYPCWYWSYTMSVNGPLAVQQDKAQQNDVHIL